MKTFLVPLVAGLTLFGGGTAAAEPAPLTATGWQLVSIDTPGGATPVADPSTFTVTFGPDGHAAFRLDCNRGGGSWQATSTAPDSGTLTFGPIAVTLMMCPQPSLDTRVAAALSSVGGWHIADGQLAMTTSSGDTALRWVPL
ncbi:MAG TPA: META domain-containing protein [Mycobacterium sp.]|nr:META domain-containing protein [Mycobacterium sp.]